MNIFRFVKNTITEHLFKQRAIIVYGARRTGKTTLVTTLLQEYNTQFGSEKSQYFDMEDPDIRALFLNAGVEKLQRILKNIDFIVFDEAQKLQNIGQTLKLLVDHFPEKQVIATGSSSFELSNKINEPLTGRKFIFHLFPISCTELLQNGKKFFELSPLLPSFLQFGMYPQILEASEKEKIPLLKELTTSYIFRDLFSFQDIKNPEMLSKILQLLAFQIGSQVSYHEIGQRLGINEATVMRYIHLLEEAFIIFRLPAFSRNLRNEISKSRKIFFWDLGIRNALIQNFNSLELRDDQGKLWENFVMAERMKYLEYSRQYKNLYFWRTYQQQEIDLIEEAGGALHAYEIKWNARKKTHPPKKFLEAYPDTSFAVITPETFWDFIV